MLEKATEEAGLAEMSAMGAGAVHGFAGPIGDDEDEERREEIRRSPLISEDKEAIINSVINKLINSQFTH